VEEAPPVLFALAAAPGTDGRFTVTVGLTRGIAVGLRLLDCERGWL
jgi:hypothetical protein